MFKVFEEIERDYLKKEHRNFELQTVTFVLGYNTIRWTENDCYVFKATKLNAAGYLKILKNNYEKYAFLGYFFQQDYAPVDKLNIILNFIYEEKECKVLQGPAYSPTLNPIENAWAMLKQRLRKLTIFCENLEENGSEIWN